MMNVLSQWGMMNDNMGLSMTTGTPQPSLNDPSGQGNQPQAAASLP